MYVSYFSTKLGAGESLPGADLHGKMFWEKKNFQKFLRKLNRKIRICLTRLGVRRLESSPGFASNSLCDFRLQFSQQQNGRIE